jgi:TatD DNase family protein
MFPNPEHVIKYCEEKKIITIGMTNLPSHFQIGINKIKTYKYIRLALGLHPLLAEKHKQEFDIFKNNIDKTSYIGEVGLDFSKDGIATKIKQIESFRYVLDLVKDKKKILSLHSRRAEKEVFEILKEFDIKNAIFHWYSGSKKVLNEIIESDYYFSINTSMITSENGKKIISEIPKNKILTETDSPYVQFMGGAARPENVIVVLKYLSVLYNEPLPIVENRVYNNFSELINKIKL